MKYKSHEVKCASSGLRFLFSCPFVNDWRCFPVGIFKTKHLPVAFDFLVHFVLQIRFHCFFQHFLKCFHMFLKTLRFRSVVSDFPFFLQHSGDFGTCRLALCCIVKTLCDIFFLQQFFKYMFICLHSKGFLLNTCCTFAAFALLAQPFLRFNFRQVARNIVCIRLLSHDC